MAVGAKPKDILGQFLIEALVLSVGGGGLGVLFGFGGAQLITRLTGTLTVISMTAVLLAFGVSALVGLSSGLYPTFRASRLDPIEALRYE